MSDFLRHGVTQESLLEFIRFHVDLGLDYLECFLGIYADMLVCEEHSQAGRSKLEAHKTSFGLDKRISNEITTKARVNEVGFHADSKIFAQEDSGAKTASFGKDHSYDASIASSGRIKDLAANNSAAAFRKKTTSGYNGPENANFSSTACGGGANGAYEEQLLACGNLSDLSSLAASFEGFPFGNASKKIVFGSGVEGATVMLVGDIPSIEDEICGKPFVDSAGRLLQAIMSSINVTKTYSTNLLLHRCHEIKFGRHRADDMMIYRAILDRHISIVRPMALLLMGGITASTMLGVDRIADAQGKEYALYNSYLGFSIPAFVIHHPELMIRFPVYKKPTWHTIRMLKNSLDKLMK